MLVYVQSEFKKYLESFCFRFIQLAKAHKPVICENSESAGAKYRHREVVEYTEVGDYPNTRLTTPGAQKPTAISWSPKRE